MMVRRRNRTVGWSQNDVHNGAFDGFLYEGVVFLCVCVGLLVQEKGGGH